MNICRLSDHAEKSYNSFFDKLYSKYNESEVYFCLKSVVMFIYFFAFFLFLPVMPNE